jgi:hypothetical protein
MYRDTRILLMIIYNGLLAAILGIALGAARTAVAYDVTPAGERLSRYLDTLDVEHHWLPGERISWRSGDPSPKGGTSSTHCSAFVAAACAGANVYILRPPEHKQTLLANAQYEWLADKGRDQGWQRVASAAEAQQRANRGELVVATYRNADVKKPGHIVLIRPSRKSSATIATEGPDIIQAGGHNHNRAALVDGFRSHASAWRNGEIAYYAHAVENGAIAAP